MPGEQEQCIFCLIKDKKSPSFAVYEDDFVISVLDRVPATKGHLIVIPKKHVSGIHELSEEEVSKLFIACQRIIFAQSQVLDCEGVNLVYSMGSGAGQRSPHMIVYLIPRYKDDQVSIVWSPAKLTDDDMKGVFNALSQVLKGAAMPVIAEKEPVVIEEKLKEEEVIEKKPRVPNY